MRKSRADLIPWDVCVPVDAAFEDFIQTAREWWCRERDTLPCSVPVSSLYGVSRVMAHGAQRYPEQDGRSWEHDARYARASLHYGAMMGHAYREGVEDESGLMHEWHAMARYMMLSALHARGMLIDDRPPAVLKDNEVIVPKGSYVVSGGDS